MLFLGGSHGIFFFFPLLVHNNFAYLQSDFHLQKYKFKLNTDTSYLLYVLQCTFVMLNFDTETVKKALFTGTLIPRFNTQMEMNIGPIKPIVCRYRHGVCSD